MFANLVSTLVVIALAASATPNVIPRRDWCTPAVAGVTFQISQASNPAYVWGLQDCTNIKCVQVTLKTGFAASVSKFVAAGYTGSGTPPLLITNAANSDFCLNAPASGSTIQGSECSPIPRQKTQEFQFRCQSCHDGAKTFGRNCQVESRDFGQCVTTSAKGDGIGAKLNKCVTGQSSQTFNLISV